MKASTPGNASDAPQGIERVTKPSMGAPAPVAPQRTLAEMKDHVIAAGGDYARFEKYSASLESEEDRAKFATIVARFVNQKTAAPATQARSAAIIGKTTVPNPNGGRPTDG